MKNLIFSLLIFHVTFVFAQEKTWKGIDEQGQELFEIQAKQVSSFKDGMARVVKLVTMGNKIYSLEGFIDNSGRLIIEPQYDKIKGTGFVNGRAWVKKKGDKYWTLIDKRGNIIPTKNYENVGYIFPFNKSVTAVYENRRMGFIDYNGVEVIPCKYVGASAFEEGLANVAEYDRQNYFGFINEQGEVVIPFKYKQTGTANFMKSGFARVKIGGQSALIDKTGNVVIKTSKGNIQGVSNNWIRLFTGNMLNNWGFMDFNEEFKIKPIYESLSDFDEYGHAVAEKGGLKGLIDTQGNTVLDFKYSAISSRPQEDGYYRAEYPSDYSSSKRRVDYFTTSLKKMENSQVLHIYPAEGGRLIPFSNIDKKHGYLNRNFEIAIPAIYSDSYPFNDGLALVAE
ncbi:WG repeat-containing protein [Weeksellaceae bacterium KMM 9713]|uniref:WG repeat-containing protein n=1 Tax=Profundicola chukchiensis TaxID=2961959 RepID=A0A9X4MXK1_9FLAO|nr:WG repeat-containing protein [Profundicola chukchiensis]MDG4946716.1 WG repeat-containing protein [Profundicola chukchiensis]